MPLPTDAELPPIYPTDVPGDCYATVTGRWECRKKGIGPNASALQIRSLIEYARKRGLTDLDQITDGFIAEWRGPPARPVWPPDECWDHCDPAGLCPDDIGEVIS